MQFVMRMIAVLVKSKHQIVLRWLLGMSVIRYEEDVVLIKQR